MKKVLYTLGLLACTGVAANAQTSAIKLNVTSLAVGTFNGSFEHAIGDKSSFQIGAFYASYGKDTEFKGFGITPEYRFYFGDKGAMQGFFVGPYVRYQNYKLSQQSVSFNTGAIYTESATLNTFGGGVNVGYQWIFGEHFSLEPFVRVGYNSGTPKSDNGNIEDFTLGVFTGTSVLPGLNLGFAF